MFQIPAKRKRDNPVLFFLSPAEQELLKSKMLEAGIKNKSAYLRKMALDGFIIKQDFSAVKNAAGELRKIGVNLNQIAKVANSYGDISISEIKALREDFGKIWELLLSMV